MTKSNQLCQIALLTTGGTIAAAPANKLAYKAGKLSGTEILDSLPPLAPNLSLKVEEIANVGSQDISYIHWRQLYHAIVRQVENDAVDAVVISHGTDTLEETAYFLQLTLPVTVPVVLTGAMKPQHALGADGAANLSDALTVAANTQVNGLGVLVVMEGQIFSGSDVQKGASQGIAAFHAPTSGPLGAVSGQQVFINSRPLKRHTQNSTLKALIPDLLPKVVVLYVCADTSVAELEALFSLQPDGIVIAGVGNGNAPQKVIQRAARAVEQGLAVVRSSRCAAAFVRRNVEINDDAMGFIAAHDHSPQTARLLLQLGLAKKMPQQLLQELFYTH